MLRPFKQIQKHWKYPIGIFAIVFQLLSYIDIVLTARNVTLVIDPIAVKNGGHATLFCLYDLGKSPLYSVRFYRGIREFYRYSPSDFSVKKTIEHSLIHVDMSLSDAHQVVLRDVQFELAGNFSCEVTEDAPSFLTATGYAVMQVIELPESKPILWTEYTFYKPDDILKANCTAPPSKPGVDLTFTINSFVIQGDTYRYNTSDNYEMTRISLIVRLQRSHFTVGLGGQALYLTLRCTANIKNLYQEHTEVDLGSTHRDPIPARVTSTSCGNYNKRQNRSYVISLLLIIFYYYHPV